MKQFPVMLWVLLWASAAAAAEAPPCESKWTFPVPFYQSVTWSPDGSRLAVAAVMSSWDDGYRIYLVAADGSRWTRLSSGEHRDLYPAWSPDGSRLAFASTRDGNTDIYITDADGSKLKRITFEAAEDSYPSWSADGSRLVFSSNRDGNHEIYVIGADGSAPTRLTEHPADDYNPSWSPRGDRIVFDADRDGDGSDEVYAIRPDGEGLVRIADHGVFPTWSPDGQLVLYATKRSLHAIRPDGAEDRLLLRDAIYGSWSPDSERLAAATFEFDAQCQDRHYLVVAGADGSDPRRLLPPPGPVPGEPRSTEPESSSPSALWPQWRGPLASGVAPDGDPPLAWGEDLNVRWKVAIPGKGHSTPIVWGRRIFLTTAIPHGEEARAPTREADGAHDNVPPTRRLRFVVLALDRGDGSILWQRTVRSSVPHESTHVTGSWASASAVTDGEHLFAFFGSQGLYALDLDGNVRWETDLGEMQVRHGHGEGSSPALFGDTLVVNWDHQGDSFIVALDTDSGAERWRVPRSEITSWSSPLIVEHGAGRQVVVSATGRVRSYGLEDGRLLWECGGLSRNVVASPVAADGLVYAANSYDWQALLAIRLADARGDITGTDAVAWTLDRHTPYVPSPLLYDGALCFLKHNQGFLSCVDAASGRPLFGPRRLPGVTTVFASPVGAAGRIYVTSRNGTTVVVARDAPFDILAVNRLDDSFSASPAIAGDELLLRGERHLYSIGESRVAE